ncbi:helicase [Streptomyces benahoarensis]|uniref:Helicase n=2 Tax=Streptomyces benahoarensis TaxID=2595054 RepID=A0A553ZPL7_9ACTN|nr:helicase [Streptomyces benahoarensis]TSB43411.1 helicase [Streptomyces benahoarensis]
MGEIPLFPHQVEFVDAVVRGLSGPLDGVMPARGLRGQVVSATGTGKTISAATAALRMVPRGLVGVLVPTLDLLTQTVQAWRAVGHKGPAVAVCSLGADPLLEALDVRCTTNPTQLALWARQGPMVVFATYASLVSQGLEDNQDGDGEGVADEERAGAPGVLEQALRGSYGQRMSPFDLLVVDEAHRTSGAMGKAWAAVHDQERISAARRLYMTATPRLWAPAAASGEVSGGEGAVSGSEGRSEALGGRLVASMDDVEFYGPVLYELGLMEAVERGILASFEVDVLEIRDPEAPGEGAVAEEVRGRRLAALQAALLKHADATGVRNLMTFHWRTLEAMAFARALPETAAELHETDPAVYPKRVGAEWLCGEHSAAHRRVVLDRYANGLDADGWVTDLGILASCQVLGEGVDIRGRRGVDGVVFADTRSSPVQIVQITGRGLRQAPGEGKVARLVVPVFLQAGEDPEDMMASASYRPLVAVLQGLRAHDSRLIERMVLRTASSRGKATSVVALDPRREEDEREESEEGQSEVEQPPAGDAGEGEEQDEAADAAAAVGDDRRPAGGEDEGQEDEDGRGGVPLLRFSLPRNPDVIAAFLRTRVLRPDSELWLSGLNALRKWVASQGHAQVPMDTVVPLGTTESNGDGGNGGTYALGAWVSEQRRAFRAGTLKAWRADLLDELGMVWSVADARFYKNLAAARNYFAAHRTLAAPKDASHDGVAVGQWLANLRKAGGLGKDEERAAERRQALERIDRDWNPPWPLQWQQRYAALAAVLADGATLAEILPGVTVSGHDIGTWLRAQQEEWEQLSEKQRERLDELGVEPLPATEVPATAKATKGGSGAFERGVAALAQYKDREGHLTVPRAHVERLEDGSEVKLGVFLSNSKSRRAKLHADRLAALAALALEWAGPPPSSPGSTEAAGDVPGPPAPSDARVPAADGDGRGGAGAEEEHRARAARSGRRAQRLRELMRTHTKTELLRMAYARGLVPYNSPEKWRKDEIASTLVDLEARAQQVKDPAPPAEDRALGTT